LKGGCYQSRDHIARQAGISSDDNFGIAGCFQHPSAIGSSKFDYINGGEAFAWLAANGSSNSRDRFD
jgi:hypothetical protein